MGTYVEGEIDVAYSRELTPDEYAAWLDAIRKGHTEAPPCGNSKHEGAPLHEVEGRMRCEHFDETPNAAGFCYTDSDRYDPEGWAIDEDLWGDVGNLEHGTNGFTIRTGGKVYDVSDACAFFVDSLPADVTAKGSGYFTSDSEPWGLIVRGREVREGWGSPVVEGDDAPQGTFVWLLGHVNFADHEVALRVFSDEGIARAHYIDELKEHRDETGAGIGERPDAPWVAHFLGHEGECLTWLDREEVSG